MGPKEKMDAALAAVELAIRSSRKAHPAASSILHADNARDIVAIIYALGRNISAADVATALEQSDD